MNWKILNYIKTGKQLWVEKENKLAKFFFFENNQYITYECNW